MTDREDAPFDNLDDAACQRALAILVDVGTSIARELQAPCKTIPAHVRAAAFDRVSLAVRRTILLSQHIAKNAQQPPEAKRADTRKKIIRAVEATIDTKADPAEAGALRLELLERVDSLDFEADLAHRSPADLITELCRDLGLANIRGFQTFPRRTPEDIALLCVQAAAPAGSGLPQWSALATATAQANDPTRQQRLVRDRHPRA